MSRLYLVISFISLIVLLSCNKFNPHNLIGTYVFNQPNDRDTLIVYANHNYIHTAYRNNKKIINTGKWKFNGVEISFHDFTFFNGGNGIWMSRVIQDGDYIKLNYADEEVFYFKLP
jgi:hypothetical protein